MTVDVDAIRCHGGYWEDLHRPLTQPKMALAVLGQLARRLAEAPRGDDEDRSLVRARLSVAGPAPDRVWILATRAGAPIDFRAWAVERREALARDGLAPFCAGLEPEIAGSFPVDPAEFYARCVPHYDGFAHAWTREALVRASYLGWSPEDRARFHHEYIRYANNDRSRAAPTSRTQHAAAWLLPHRRYVLQWRLALREDPEPRPAWTRRVEGPLLTAIQDLRRCAEQKSQPWEVPALEALLEAPYARRGDEHGAYEEVLRRLGCDEGRIRRLRLIHAAYDLPRANFGPLEAAHERVARLAREALSWCW